MPPVAPFSEQFKIEAWGGCKKIVIVRNSEFCVKAGHRRNGKWRRTVMAVESFWNGCDTPKTSFPFNYSPSKRLSISELQPEPVIWWTNTPPPFLLQLHRDSAIAVGAFFRFNKHHGTEIICHRKPTCFSSGHCQPGNAIYHFVSTSFICLYKFLCIKLFAGLSERQPDASPEQYSAANKELKKLQHTVELVTEVRKKDKVIDPFIHFFMHQRM